MDPQTLVGSTLADRYSITRILGQGGMGCVFEANHIGTNRRVAIKVISTGDFAKNDSLVTRFQREAKAAGGIESQHIAQVLDTGTDPKNGLPYMVMEFMLGEDVQQLLSRAHQLSPELAMRLVAQACYGLQKAHDAGVVHRDIKPANLFLARRDGGEVIVKLLDFGIAKVKMEHASEMGDAGLTRTGTMLGSPLYMSPEQARGAKRIDHRADIWSLGVVLYQALAGRTPLQHIDALGELIIAICHEPSPPIQDFAPWIPKPLAAIVHRALERDPDKRYQTATEMLEAIRTMLPHGSHLDEGMLVGITEAEKATVAPRLTVPPPSTLASSNSLPPPAPHDLIAPAETAVGTNDGVASPSLPPPPATVKAGARSPNLGLIIGGAVVGLAAAAGVAVFVMNKNESPVPLPPASSIAAASTAATAATSSEGPAVTPLVEKTVKLVVFPDEVTVELDGKPAKVKNGVIEVSGTLGSVHKVKLTIAGSRAELEEDVVVTESGALPPKLELDVKAPPGSRPKASSAPTAAPVVPGKPALPPGTETKFGD